MRTSDCGLGITPAGMPGRPNRAASGHFLTSGGGNAGWRHGQRIDDDERGACPAELEPGVEVVEKGKKCKW